MPRAATITLAAALAAPLAMAWATASAAEDRYGPPPADVASVATAPTSGWLSWSNKAPQSVAPTFASAPFKPYASPAHVAPALPTSLYAAYGQPNPLQAAAAGDTPSPPRWASPSQLASAAPRSGQTPHFYSVHREFGLSPDPIPLPRQFFADSAATDLAAAPPPLAPHPVAGTQAAASPANSPANRARALALDTADSAVN